MSTPPPTPPLPSLRIAIHLHLYHLAQATGIADRLHDFPAPFDLFISVASAAAARVASVCFSHAGLPQMSTLDIVEVPSRGRDVAPWLVTFGARLSAYGLACHIHTKTSAHFDFGDTWREYLFDNLIDPEAARDIIQHMARDGRLGIVFPPLFGPLAQFMTRRRIPTLGLENESRLCDALCKKINLPITARRHNTLFSAGTMFWYRPAALEPLIQAGLTYDDFPPEPIGVGGTLAHAIERLPALVAESQGYQTRCYLRQSELLDNSWEQSRSEALATPKRSLEEWPGFGVAYTVFSRLFPTGSRRHAVAKRLALRAVRLLRAD